MNAGTLIFLIVVILVAFGFMTSEYIDTQQKVQDLQFEVNSVTQQLGERQTQLVSCQDQSKKNIKTIQDQQVTIGDLETHMSDLKHQINELKFQNTILELQRSVIDFVSSNPVLLIGALLAPIATSAFRFSRILGLRPTEMGLPSNDEYVRLSLDERAWLITKRRNGQSRRNNS